MEDNRPKFWKAEFRREYFYPRHRKQLAGKWRTLHNSAGLFLPTPQQVLLSDEMKGDKVQVAYGVWQVWDGRETLATLIREYLKENHLGDLGVDGIIILKLVLDKCTVTM
jgi:hypothetical protein